MTHKMPLKETISSHENAFLLHARWVFLCVLARVCRAENREKAARKEHTLQFPFTWGGGVCGIWQSVPEGLL